MIYLFGLLILLLLNLVIKNNRKVFLFLSAFLIILIMSLRGSNVGTDSETYLHLFDLASNGYKTLLDSKAPLFVAVLKVHSWLFGTGESSYFFITSLLIIVPLWWAIYLSGVPEKKAILVYYLLFFQSSLNETRTYISISLVILSYVLSRQHTKKNSFISLFILFIAVFIHKIAVIGIPILALSFMSLGKMNKRKIIMVFITCGCLFLNVFVNFFSGYFSVYANTLASVKDTVGASAYIFQILMVITLIQSFCIIRKRKDTLVVIKKDDYDNMVIVLFSEVMIFIAGGNTWYIQRILKYLEIFVIFLFPILEKISNKYRQLYCCAFYIIAIFLFIYGIIRNLNGVMPYTFFWQ